jgi:hypothetical protein
MTIPQLLVDLTQLLFDMAVPAAMCTLVLAGLALRQESGVNFEVGGRFQRWMLWSVILLTLPHTHGLPQHLSKCDLRLNGSTVFGPPEPSLICSRRRVSGS